MNAQNAGRILAVHKSDNVGTALVGFERGEEVRVMVGQDSITLVLPQTIAAGHKVAVRRISEGSDVVKYGYPIGEATTDIEPGQHVHVHNVASRRGRGDMLKA